MHQKHNVLIAEDGVAKLCDFGRSNIIGHRGYTTTFTGTARYMAPELIGETPFSSDTHPSGSQNDSLVTDQEPFVPRLSKATDVYGFGVLAMEVSHGSSS